MPQIDSSETAGLTLANTDHLREQAKQASKQASERASKHESKQASKHPWNRNGFLMRNENSKSSQVGDPQIHTRRHKPHTNKKENRKEIGRIRTCQIGSYSLPVNMLLRPRARWVRFESWPSAAGISPTSRPHQTDPKACKTLAQKTKWEEILVNETNKPSKWATIDCYLPLKTLLSRQRLVRLMSSPRLAGMPPTFRSNHSHTKAHNAIRYTLMQTENLHISQSHCAYWKASWTFTAAYH